MPHLRAHSEAEDEVREMTGRYMAQQYESTLRDSIPQGASVFVGQPLALPVEKKL